MAERAEMSVYAVHTITFPLWRINWEILARAQKKGIWEPGGGCFKITRNEFAELNAKQCPCGPPANTPGRDGDSVFSFFSLITPHGAAIKCSGSSQSHTLLRADGFRPWPNRPSRSACVSLCAPAATTCPSLVPGCEGQAAFLRRGWQHPAEWGTCSQTPGHTTSRALCAPRLSGARPEFTPALSLAPLLELEMLLQRKPILKLKFIEVENHMYSNLLSWIPIFIVKSECCVSKASFVHWTSTSYSCYAFSC